MRIDRPSSRPEDSGESSSRPAEGARPPASELRDDNGLNPAEYIAAWNKKVESGEAEREQAAEERPHRRDVDLRDSNGMTAAELRFRRSKEIDEAEAKTSEGAGGELPPRRSVVTDAHGRTGAEIRFQDARRAEVRAAAEAAAENPEPVSEGDDKPEKQREFKTLTEEFGESRTFGTFDAARRTSIREHGPRPGQDLHHLVERSQARPERSGFSQEQIHSSDNLGWLDRPVHEKITARYNKGIPGFSRLRDSLDGLPFETQHAFGRSVVDEEIRKYRGDD